MMNKVIDVARAYKNSNPAFEENVDSDFAIWSALTLKSLNSAIEGKQEDPRYSTATELVEMLNEEYSDGSPIPVNDYFDAVKILADINGSSSNLDGLEYPDDSE